MKKIAVGMITLLYSCLSYAADTIATFETKYSASLYGYNLDITSNLKKLSNGTYQLYNHVDSYAGELVETSQISWDDAKKITTPLAYKKYWSALGKRSDEQVRFDWTKRTAANTTKNTSFNLNGISNVQDNLSYQLQMRQDFLAGKKSVSYNVTDGQKNSSFVFEIVKEEIIDSALGKVKAVKVKRVQSGTKETYVWLAKDYQYLLIKFEQRKDGFLYTFTLNKAVLNGKPIQRF